MNLVICGNGLDLHHGLKTSYPSYKCYLKKNAGCILDRFINFPWIKQSNKHDLWTDVEQSLAFDYERMCSELSRNYLSEYNNGDENAIVELQTDLEDWTRFIYSFTGELFYQWLSSINPSASKPDQMLEPLFSDSIIVTFNYTNTLESLYHITPERILHIHGKLISVHDEDCMSGIRWPLFKEIEEAEAYSGPVFESDKWNSSIIRQEIQFGAPTTKDIRCRIDSILKSCEDENICNTLLDFTQNTIKHLPRNIPALESFLGDKELSDIYIMGLSICGPDDYYFKHSFVPKYKECKWHLFFHGENEIEAEQDRLAKQLFVKQYSIGSAEYLPW